MLIRVTISDTATAPVWHVETSHHSAKGKAVVKEMAVNVLGFVRKHISIVHDARLISFSGDIEFYHTRFQ